MDPTTQAFLAAALGAVVAGAAAIAWHISDRQQHRMPDVADPIVPPEVATVLSVLRSSAVIVDTDDTVLKASAPAYALGLVRGTSLLSNDLADLVHEVRRDGQIRETELVMTRPGAPSRHVTARVAPLGSRLVLALVEDRTRERRVEAVRRDFVANVSHELKTPVGALSLLSEAVMDASDDPEAVERFAGRMQIEATRLTNLVQELIDLSRVQNDDPLEDAEPVRIDELVAEAVDRCRHQAGTKQITMASNVRVPDGLGHGGGTRRAGGSTGLHVWGNRGQLAAALGNLVENAVNYSPARTRVGISARRVSVPGGDLIEIAVTDQGIGISGKDKERIFERFYRVDPARSRATGGTGLGLAIVKHVAASHGGEVTVWSSEGQGSTFTLRLPEAGAARDRATDHPADLDDEDGRPDGTTTVTSPYEPLPAPEVLQ